MGQARLIYKMAVETHTADVHNISIIIILISGPPTHSVGGDQ